MISILTRIATAAADSVHGLQIPNTWPLLLMNTVQQKWRFQPGEAKVLSLPTETLIEIFLTFAELIRLHHPQEAAQMMVRLSHVCPRWYYVMTDMPSLWTDINIKLSGPLVLLFLARSKSLPIHVQAKGGLKLKDCMSIQRLRSERHRTVTIDADLDPHFSTSFFTALGTELPVLTEMNLRLKNLCKCGTGMVIDDEVYCPSLRVLKTSNVLLSPRLYQGLEKLTICFSHTTSLSLYAVVGEVLMNAPLLKHLHLRGSFSYQPSPFEIIPLSRISTSSVYLDKLEYLRLAWMDPHSINALLRVLNIPQSAYIALPCLKIEDLFRMLGGGLVSQTIYECTHDHHLSFRPDCLLFVSACLLMTSTELQKEISARKGKTCSCPHIACHVQRYDSAALDQIISGLDGNNRSITHLTLPPPNSIDSTVSIKDLTEACFKLYGRLPYLTRIKFLSIVEDEGLIAAASPLSPSGLDALATESSSRICTRLAHVHVSFAQNQNRRLTLTWLKEMISARMVLWGLSLRYVTLDFSEMHADFLPPLGTIEALKKMTSYVKVEGARMDQFR